MPGWRAAGPRRVALRLSAAALSPAALSPTERSTPRRHRDRARSDRVELHALLDACLVCHLGLVVDGTPVVLPTGYGRDGDTLYLHSSSGAASLLTAAAGAPVCVTVTRLDGVVYARAVFNHSVNYASTVVTASRARSPTTAPRPTPSG